MPIKIDTIKEKTVAEATEAKTDWGEILNRDIALFGSGFGNKNRVDFYTELLILLSAGLDIYSAISLIETSTKKKKHRELFGQIKELILKGDALSDALENTGRFSDYEIHSIKIGEETGQLTGVLEELGQFFTKAVKFRQQLVGALSYPAFVLVFAVLVVMFMLNFLVPMFSDIYGRFDGELPSITLKIIALSEWSKEYLLWIILFLLIGGLLLRTQNKTALYRKVKAKILLNLPIFGGIIHDLYQARFCQSMKFLLTAKIPLLTAIRLVKKMIGFYPIEVSIADMETDVLKGSSLHSTLSKFSFYPPQMVALIKVGEETGKLDEMLGRLSQQYTDSVDRKTALVGSLLEPVLIIGIGALVGVILIAMYLPLFKLSTTVG